MTNAKKNPSANARRGIVLTLDIAIAMMLLLVSIAAAYAAYGAPSRAGFDIQLMRNYLQDSATLMSDLGYLSDAANAANGSDTSGIREVLRATPSTVCMQVTGYGTVLGQDLEGYWKFDEDSGSVASDSSGNGNVGTVSENGTSFSSIGKNGHALSLDGAAGYVNAAKVSSSGDVSISAWINPSTLRTSPAGHNQRVFHNYDGSNDLQIILNESNLFRWGTASGEAGADVSLLASPIPPNAWMHIAVTRSGSTYAVYFNGMQQETSTGVPGDPVPTTQALRIGADIFGTGANGHFNGAIDDVRIYSRALTENEIRLLYSNPSNILFVVDKPECAFSGGEVQTLTVPFTLNADQEENEYYYATLRAWVAGAGK